MINDLIKEFEYMRNLAEMTSSHTLKGGVS